MSLWTSLSWPPTTQMPIKLWEEWRASLNNVILEEKVQMWCQIIKLFIRPLLSKTMEGSSSLRSLFDFQGVLWFPLLRITLIQPPHSCAEEMPVLSLIKNAFRKLGSFLWKITQLTRVKLSLQTPVWPSSTSSSLLCPLPPQHVMLWEQPAGYRQSSQAAVVGLHSGVCQPV